jgi:hypothetical protein
VRIICQFNDYIVLLVLNRSNLILSRSETLHTCDSRTSTSSWHAFVASTHVSAWHMWVSNLIIEYEYEEGKENKPNRNECVNRVKRTHGVEQNQYGHRSYKYVMYDR